VANNRQIVENSNTQGDRTMTKYYGPTHHKFSTELIAYSFFMKAKYTYGDIQAPQLINGFWVVITYPK
jgi:hypothetical protein